MGAVGRPPIPEANRRRLTTVVDRLDGLLPSSWIVAVERRNRDGGDIEIVAPDGAAATLSVVTR